jgi:hypothetical protein
LRYHNAQSIVDIPADDWIKLAARYHEAALRAEFGVAANLGPAAKQ